MPQLWQVESISTSSQPGWEPSKNHKQNSAKELHTGTLTKQSRKTTPFPNSSETQHWKQRDLTFSIRNNPRAKLTCVQRGVKCLNLWTALLSWLSPAYFYAMWILQPGRGGKALQWFQPEGFGPADASQVSPLESCSVWICMGFCTDLHFPSV